MNLPEGWKWVRLGEVSEITTGKSNVEDAVDNGLYPLFDRSLQIKRSNKYIFNTEAVIIPGESQDFIPKYYIGKFDLHQRAYAIFNFHKYIYGKYLYYVLHLANKQLIRQSVGTTVISLRLPHIQNIQIPLPPLPQQKKIAEILETVDKIIEKTEKIIEKYKRIKQGLMQELFTKGIDENGKIRDEKTHRFKDSPIGRIPEEWEVVRLGEVVEKVKAGGTPTTSISEYYQNGNIPFVKIEDLTYNGKYLKSTMLKITEKGLKSSSAWLVPKNSLLFGMYGSLGEISINKIEVATNQAILGIVPNSESVDLEYLYYWFFYFKPNWHLYAKTTTQANLTKEIIENFLIPLPPLPEQERIAQTLSQIDKVIESEQKYKQKLESLKRGLMEDLLTGRLRVNF